MDFQEARHRREASVPEPPDGRRATIHKRAKDARLRRAIREAFALQKQGSTSAGQAPPRPHVVDDEAP